MNNAFRPADILIPNKNVNIKNWSVIACDQYTSEAQYWQQTEKNVGNDLSTLNLILPEIFLENDIDRHDMYHTFLDILV